MNSAFRGSVDQMLASPLPSSSAVCVVASNPLAGQYLARVLTENSFARLVVFEEAAKNLSSSTDCIVFVLDMSHLPSPLVAFVKYARHSFMRCRFVVIDAAQSNGGIEYLLKIGVHGVLEYSEVETMLQLAVQEVNSGRLWISSSQLGSLVSKERSGPRHMTIRELEVLELLKRRLSNKEIGNILSIGENTVKYHVSNILGKLQVSNRHDLLRKSETADLWSPVSR